MKKKLALLMAAIMTVAMVPMTAFASTKLTAVDEISTAVEKDFVSVVELVKNDDQVDIDETKYPDNFEVILKLTNGKFAKDDDDNYYMDAKDNDDVKDYLSYLEGKKYISSAVAADAGNTIWSIDIKNDTTAYIKLDTKAFNHTTAEACVLPIMAQAVETGDVTAEFTSNVTQFKKASEVIATAYADEVAISTEGVVTFVEDADKGAKDLKDISINGLVNDAIDGTKVITLKLKGNYEFNVNDKGWLLDDTKKGDFEISFLNSDAEAVTKASEDELEFTITGLESNQLTKMLISNLEIVPTKKCKAGDVATITVSSKNFDSTKLEVAKMVEEAVTYTVEDDELPTIWAGKDYSNYDTKQNLSSVEDANTLEVSIEENTGDILNTSRKATFTFPEGIEVVDIDTGKSKIQGTFRYEIDENVVEIWNYAKPGDESEGKTDLGIKFVLNAAPTFSGDVTVTLGGEFDDVEFKVATVKAPYTVEAKTSEVLIDYRYVPVNEIVIKEADVDLLEEGDVIVLGVEKMDFEDAGKYEVTSGDIEVDVTIDDAPKGIYESGNYAYLFVEVKDESTEASTITISGLELYLDRTLPVGGYALKNVGGRDVDTKEAINILWENSTDVKDEKAGAYNYVPDEDKPSNGLFKYDAVTVNDSYVEVVTAGRDQDDSSTTRKIVITIGSTTMAVGTETVTLDAPAYINSDNYTMLPLRAVSEAFGATVGWDDASRTVTLMMGQRIVSMTIGSKTMYINGTPVAMNTAPEIVSERTFLPVRDLCNALGITKIDWNEASATVTLN